MSTYVSKYAAAYRMLLAVIVSFLFMAKATAQSGSNDFGYTTPPNATSASSAPVGSPQGTFNVSPLGGATYSIGIEAPQGLAGIQPSIAIVYNSQAGNGIVGYGCNLSGLSVITRGPRTIFHDGEAGGITHGKDDAFYLDGQRLVLREHTEGSDSSVYCLENNPFFRVVLHGLTGTTQTSMWFSGQDGDGMKYEYGHTTGQQLYIVNSITKVNAWYINRIENSVGNNMTYSYLSDNYYLYPQYIIYGDNTHAYTGNYSNRQKIEFDYEVRSNDPIPFFIEGTEGTVRYRLKHITTKQGSDVYRTYTLNYSTTADTTYTKFSRLTSVSVANGNGQSMNPIVLNWQGLPARSIQAQSLPVSTNVLGGTIDHENSSYSCGDVNGDGLTDILEKALVHPNQNIGHDRIYYRIHTAQRNSDGSIGFQVNEVTQLSGDFSFGEDFYQSYYMSTAADVDGDGIGELLVTERVRGPEANNVQFLFFGDNSFKTGFKYVKETEGSDVYGLGDLNNDGKSDIVIIEKSSSSGYYAGAVMGIKTANTDAFRRPFHFTLPCDPENVYVADINIDGMADIVVIHGNGYTIFWNDGTWLDSYTTLCTPSPTTGTFSNLHPAQAFPGDFNGDGITDFLVTVTDDDTWYLELGRGDGSFSHMTACTIYAYDQSNTNLDDDLLSCYIYDMDGDGKSDVFISKGMYYPYIPGPFKNTYTYWLRSTGESLQQIKTSTSVRKLDSSPRYYLIGDFNGDGYSELANNGYDCYNGDANVDPTWHVYPNTAFNAAVGKVSSVTNGFGATTSISYKSMTDNTVYTRGTQTEPTGSAIINCPPVLHVVSSTTSDDGAAGQQTVNYQYGGLKAHVRGKGLLGMSYTKVSNVTQGTATESVISGWNTESLQPVRRTARQYKGTDMSQAVTHYVSSKPYSQKAWFTRPDSLIQTDMDGNVSGVLPDYDPQHGYLRQKIEYWDDAHFEHNYSGYSCYGGVWLPGSIEDVRYSLTSDELTTVTHLEYNAYGLKTLETVNYNSSKPLTHAYTYDACGNLYTETVSGSGVTANTKTYGYDDTKRFVTSVTESSGNQSLVSSFTYDTWGHLLTETSRTTGNNPLTTTHIYDGWGNRTRTELPSGQVRAFSQGWGSTASQCYFTLEQGTATPWVKTWYDRSGRKMSEESRTVMDGPFVSIWTYDNRGRLTTTSTVTEALSMGEQTTYDGRDRLLTRVSTTGSSQGYTYGNRTVTVTDGANRSYTKTYDPRGNLLSSSDPSGTVSYVNDADGKPLSITAHGTTVTVSYDDRGNRYQLCDPDAGTMTYVYDALGRVISQTDARSNQATFTYDGFGNLTATAINGQPHTSHTYSYTGATAGLLMNESAGGATVSYTYDAYDRLATKSYSLPQTVMAQAQQYSYTYSTNGLVQSITYPGSLTVGYNYDCYGNKIRTTSAGTTVWEMEWYDGQITVVNHTNSIQSCKGLDSRGHLQQLYMLKDHGGDYGIDFVYDGATGNLTERWNIEQAQQELFTYDTLDRLTGAGGQTYSYASNGNLTYKTGIGHYTYDSSKPHAVTSIENTARLMDMSRLDTEYNGFGKIERIHNDETNRSLDFLYGPDEERYCSIQRDSAGSVERETVYLDGLDIVVDGQGNKEWFYYVDDHVITKKTGSGTFSHYFTFTDQVGSILKVVDANETERFSATYDPWGRQTVTLNEIGLIRGFTGHEMLTEYGLINMNGRLYDPLLGRFLSTDNFVQEPGSTQSFNRYSYCLNNPLKYNDPSGEWFGIDDLIVAGAGFIFGYVSNGISSGNWGWSSLMSGVSTAAMSWLGYNTAGMATGTINAATWNSITNLGLNTAINMMLPPINIPMGNFTLTMSPAFGFGEGGLNSGLNIGIVYSDDDFHFGLNAGVGSTYIGWFAEVGYRNVTAGYGLTYYKGTTIGDYAIGKQTVGTGKISWGDFSLTVSNDLFSEKKQDRWRTSAVEVGIGDFLIGTSVFTNNGKEESPYIGDKKYSSVEDPIVGKHLYKDLDGNTYGSWNNGKVFSAPFWIGHRNGCQVFRAGISSKVVQSLTQNFVHKWMRTPYFLNYNNFKSGAFSYYGYYNPLTLWNN